MCAIMIILLRNLIKQRNIVLHIFVDVRSWFVMMTYRNTNNDVNEMNKSQKIAYEYYMQRAINLRMIARDHRNVLSYASRQQIIVDARANVNAARMLRVQSWTHIDAHMRAIIDCSWTSITRRLMMQSRLSNIMHNVHTRTALWRLNNILTNFTCTWNAWTTIDVISSRHIVAQFNRTTQLYYALFCWRVCVTCYVDVVAQRNMKETIMNAQHAHHMNVANIHMRDAYRLRRMRALMLIEIAFAKQHIEIARYIRTM